MIIVICAEYDTDRLLPLIEGNIKNIDYKFAHYLNYSPASDYFELYAWLSRGPYFADYFVAYDTESRQITDALVTADFR